MQFIVDVSIDIMTVGIINFNGMLRWEGKGGKKYWEKTQHILKMKYQKKSGRHSADTL